MKKSLILLSSVLLVACGANQSQTSPSTSKGTPNISQASSSQASQSESSSTITSSSPSESQAAAVDLAQVAQGDYTSLKGTWQAQDGFGLTFSETGLVSQDYELGGFSLTDYGTASAGVYSKGDKDGFIMELIPAGQSLPEAEDSDTGLALLDDSDQTVDRIWVGTGLNGRGSQGRFLYRK